MGLPLPSPAKPDLAFYALEVCGSLDFQRANSFPDLLLPLQYKTLVWAQKVGCKADTKRTHSDTNCNFIPTCWRRKDIIIRAGSLLPEEVIRMSPKAEGSRSLSFDLPSVCLDSHFLVLESIRFVKGCRSRQRP